MKTKNLPEKKRQRQISALERLKKVWDGRQLSFSAEVEMRKLKKVTKVSLRDVRTKKKR